tara:strand:- start:2436 stop:2987 length:552 start_codon:yes stop_codon:yes gene_type:complete
MKYFVKTIGKLCHYQFSNIKDSEVNDIELGEMDYNQVEETFLLDKCSIENQKISVDDEVKFQIFDDRNNKILEFYSKEIEQRDEGGDCFCPEPQYNEEYENCLGAFNYWKGGGPIFEFKTSEKLKIENFSYSVLIFELDDGEITLMDDLFHFNNKLESVDFDDAWGSNRMFKIWKQNGEVFNF